MSQDDLGEYQHRRLSEEIATISAQLTNVAETSRPQLPERHFREIFLPFFAGDTELIYKVDLSIWLNVSGSPYREVDIVDQQGKILFAVPALLDRNAINPIPMDRYMGISHVVASAQQYAQIHPLQGARHLSAELTRRALIMKVPANVMKDLEAWNNIFTRYGRPPLVAVPENDQSGTDADAKQKNDGPDFELELL